jgi:hypothetical protein
MVTKATKQVFRRFFKEKGMFLDPEYCVRTGDVHAYGYRHLV